MSLARDFELTYSDYLKRFRLGIPARVMRSMPIEEQLAKLKDALDNGKPVDWGIETAAPDPNSLLPYEPDP